jgi:hypothetical protein
MQQQHVVRLTLREQILDVGLDHVGRFVADRLYVESPDLPVAEHSFQSVGVGGR